MTKLVDIDLFSYWLQCKHFLNRHYMLDYLCLNMTCWSFVLITLPYRGSVFCAGSTTGSPLLVVVNLPLVKCALVI